MSITYKYSVNQLECYPTCESHSDVVFRVSWRYSGVNADGVGSSRGGVQEVTYVAGSPFTPFNKLTEAQVLGWLAIPAELQSEMEAGIAGDIQWQIDQANANNPVSPPLPWGGGVSGDA